MRTTTSAARAPKGNNPATIPVMSILRTIAFLSAFLMQSKCHLASTVPTSNHCGRRTAMGDGTTPCVILRRPNGFALRAPPGYGSAWLNLRKKLFAFHCGRSARFATALANSTTTWLNLAAQALSTG
jgi:hypothetical protein